MPKRRIIRIDEALCDGCGKCLSSCVEGALALVNGKVHVREGACDGLGACLGECPRGAMSIEENEAEPFDSQTVTLSRSATRPRLYVVANPHEKGGCPGAAERTFAPPARVGGPSSKLAHFPVKLRLVSVNATFLRGADIVVCADCVPFAVPDFHERYLAGRAVVAGCPKFDDPTEMESKLAAIVAEARPERLTVLRMEVPCCNGIALATFRAAKQSGFSNVVEEVVSLDGRSTPVKVR